MRGGNAWVDGGGGGGRGREGAEEEGLHRVAWGQGIWEKREGGREGGRDKENRIACGISDWIPPSLPFFFPPSLPPFPPRPASISLTHQQRTR